MAQQNETLTPEALEAVRKSKDVRLRLAYELKLTTVTVDRWVKKNDPKLSQHRVMQIISEETGIPTENLLRVA